MLQWESEAGAGRGVCEVISFISERVSALNVVSAIAACRVFPSDTVLLYADGTRSKGGPWRDFPVLLMMERKGRFELYHHHRQRHILQVFSRRKEVNVLKSWRGETLQGKEAKTV